jgi:surface antigen
MTSSFKFMLGSVVALVALAAGPAAAQDMRFMSDTPYVHFNKDDKAMFRKAMMQALDTAKDGDTSTWSNPASGAGGEIKVLKSYEAKNQKCRTLSIANKAKARSNAGEYNFCAKAGKWTLSNSQ